MQKIGLSKIEVSKERELYGGNILPEPPCKSFAEKLSEQFKEPLIRILLIALTINIALALMGEGEWLETVGIFLAIAIATIVSTYSEYRSEGAFRSLQAEATRSTCKVWRDGTLQELVVEEVVVGDAVLLEAGDKVPADGIMLEGAVQVDQSALNGESEAIEKSAKAYELEAAHQLQAKGDLLDAYSLTRGSVVVSGQGVMKVTQVGSNTLYGQLAQELRESERESPLQLKLKRLAQKISKLGYSMGILIALAMLMHKVMLHGGVTAFLNNSSLALHELTQALIMAIIIIVMAVPEGLPLMIAIVCSLNMRKMLADNVLVRKLIGIETAGSLNLLFTDKTGTITKGKLEVVCFIDGEGNEYSSLEDITPRIKTLIAEQIVLNSSSTYSEGKALGGNMTENALNNFYFPGNNETSISSKRIAFLPFNSENKYSAALVNRKGSLRTLYKGAPEVLLANVHSYYDKEGNLQLWSEVQAKALEQKQNALAKRAMRLLAFCSYEVGSKANAEEVSKLATAELAHDKWASLKDKQLTLLGIVAIRDDVRPEAVMALQEVQQAGVQVVMITGDRKETAMAIAREAQLLQNETDIVLTSSELAQLSDAQVKGLLPHLRVVARALPLDKLRLVRLAQELNLVVGMTGDGVNDAPALKRADVGFAMGSGTEVAKEAGEIIILDDNFLSIKQAILYGRTIYHNISKFLTFQLTINCAAVGISFLAPFLNIEMPLTITQILWINLIMDTLAAIAFGSEPALEGYLKEEPKRRDSELVTNSMLAKIIIASGYMTLISVLFFKSALFTSLFRTSACEVCLYTGFFCSFVLMAVANAFNVRREDDNSMASLAHNPSFLVIMVGIVCVQIVLTYIGGEVLRTVPLNLTEWLAVLGSAITVLIIGQLTRLFSK